MKLSPNVTRWAEKFPAQANLEFPQREAVEALLILQCLFGEFKFVGVDEKGRLAYQLQEKSQSSVQKLSDNIALAHHRRVIEIIRKRLLAKYYLDEIAILLLGQY